MKLPVQLYLRAKLGDGSYPYLKAAILPNGHVRPGYAINAGHAVKIDNGVYQLRYQQNGKRVWEPIGTDAALALIALRKKLREFEDGHFGLSPAPVKSAGRQEDEQPKEKQSKRLLSACIVEYLAEIEEHREKKTCAAYKQEHALIRRAYA